jgi:hypothetical protein
MKSPGNPVGIDETREKYTILFSIFVTGNLGRNTVKVAMYPTLAFTREGGQGARGEGARTQGPARTGHRLRLRHRHQKLATHRGPHRGDHRGRPGLRRRRSGTGTVLCPSRFRRKRRPGGGLPPALQPAPRLPGPRTGGRRLRPGPAPRLRRDHPRGKLETTVSVN